MNAEERGTDGRGICSICFELIKRFWYWKVPMSPSSSTTSYKRFKNRAGQQVIEDFSFKSMGRIFFDFFKVCDED